MASPITVVVPVGPGDRAWRGLLGPLAALPSGSTLCLVACREEDVDATGFASQPGLPDDRRWLVAPCGRARQLNAGARSTGGERLWFLHADSRFDDAPAAIAALGRTLEGDPGTLGYFDLRFDGDGPAATAINAAGAWIRSHWLGLPFGDQGLFLARATFERLGGFDESLPVAEDHALVWRARALGVPVRAAGATLRTSARRYAEQGWARTTARHLLLTATQAWRFSRARAPQP